MDIYILVKRKVAEYWYYNGKEPNAIYVGVKEWEEILGLNKGLINVEDNENMLTLMGMEILRVNREKYFKVGYVEEVGCV